MNKEYIGIYDGVIAVSDEKGKITRRPVCCDINKLLVLENDLEYINSVIKDLENFKKYTPEYKFNYVSVLVKLGLFGMASFGFAIADQEDTAIRFMIVGAILTIFDPILKDIVQHNDYKKVNEAYDLVLKHAYQLKTATERLIAETKEHTNRTTNISVKTPVKIEPDYELIDEYKSQFTEKFNSAVKSPRLRRNYSTWR